MKRIFVSIILIICTSLISFSTVNAEGNSEVCPEGNGKHIWNYNRTITEPTCTKEGVGEYKCSKCGKTKIEKTNASGHSWHADYRSTIEATCTEEGEQRYTCWDCDEVKYEVIPAKGHSLSYFKTTIKEATCTEDGLQERTCYICDEKVLETIPAKGHSIIHMGYTAPTNNKVGYTEGDYCSRCGYVLNGRQVIPMTTYTSEWVNGKWYDKNGKLQENSSITWHKDSTGWWYTNEKNKYFTDHWNKIDGIWYYFKPDGYMAQNEWYNGYWFGGSGAWTYTYTLSWHRDSHGWWVEDSSGWYPKNQWQKIDGYWYYFNGSGYMVVNQYVDGYWLGIDGTYF